MRSVVIILSFFVFALEILDPSTAFVRATNPNLERALRVERLTTAQQQIHHENKSPSRRHRSGTRNSTQGPLLVSYHSAVPLVVWRAPDPCCRFHRRPNPRTSYSFLPVREMAHPPLSA